MKSFLLRVTLVLTLLSMGELSAFSQENGGSDAVASFRIDLTDSPVYVRVGFSESYLESVPPAGSEWSVFPPTERSRRTLRVTDPMIDFFVKGTEVYELSIHLSNAGRISRRVARTLNRYLDPGEVEFLSICFSEIVINAIEHGSLQVTFEDKTRAMQEERYFDFLLERQNTPEFRDRTVRVE